MELVNCTPHQVCIMLPDGTAFGLEPSGVVPRCEETTFANGYIEAYGLNIPISCKSFGTVYDLPEPKAGVAYIVSAITAQAIGNDRDDILIPGPAVRDVNGKVIGCKGLCRI